MCRNSPIKQIKNLIKSSLINLLFLANLTLAEQIETIKNMSYPIAKEIIHSTKYHDIILEDRYHWLRDKNWPKVKDKDIIKYLKNENQYASSYFKDLKSEENKIFEELKGRIKLSNKSVPIKSHNFYYYSKINSTQQYAVHYRTKNPKKKGQLLLDENLLARQKKFFRLGGAVVSSKENLLAYSINIDGSERYVLRIKDIATGKHFDDELHNVSSFLWQEGDLGIYYIKLDENWRGNRVFYHFIGTKQEDDILIYHEKDDVFSLGLTKTTDDQYILITPSSSTSSEIRYIKSDDLERKINILVERRPDHLCSADHFTDYFYLTTNDKGRNFRLVRFKDGDKKYQELIPHSSEIYFRGATFFRQYSVIETKENGLTKIYLYDFDKNTKEEIHFPDSVYVAGVIDSDPEDDGVHIYYSSLIAPSTHYKKYFHNSKMETLKTQEIPSGYDKNLYQTERIWIKSRDGKVKIPVSLVYKKDLFKNDSSNPLYLYGYGSYGIAVEPKFSTNYLTLLDKGFVYAIAHIRGGDELGFDWYEQAKFLNKKRTFEDFIDVAEGLIDKKYTSKGNIVIMGGSAGGTLIGNVINSNPGLFKAAIAHVPFVDVLNTMLDETLPLTPGEFEEWGNPKEKRFFDYLRSYSPYDNIKSQKYPHLYVTAGINDPRVTYWEVAKWVAKLRKYKQDNNLLVFETNMNAGHSGKSGRFGHLKELAKEYTFIFDIFTTIHG